MEEQSPALLAWRPQYKKRFKGIMSKLQTEGTRSKSGVDM
jgi:hypothetical protein